MSNRRVDVRRSNRYLIVELGSSDRSHPKYWTTIDTCYSVLSKKRVPTLNSPRILKISCSDPNHKRLTSYTPSSPLFLYFRLDFVYHHRRGNRTPLSTHHKWLELKSLIENKEEVLLRVWGIISFTNRYKTTGLWSIQKSRIEKVNVINETEIIDLLTV